MALWIDQKYLGLLSMRLDRYQRKSDKLYNFRCPFCGDSKKNKWKARGYVYVKKDGMFYKCHNCGHGTNLRGLIEHVDSNMASQYGMEHFKEGKGNSEKKERLFEFNTPKFKKKDNISMTFEITKNCRMKMLRLN